LVSASLARSTSLQSVMKLLESLLDWKVRKHKCLMLESYLLS